MLFFLPLAPSQLFAGLCFFASVSVGIAAFLFTITPPYLGCRGCWWLRRCRLSAAALAALAALAAAAAAAEDAGLQWLAVVRGGEGVHAPSEA
jgi:hypothetical protein